MDAFIAKRIRGCAMKYIGSSSRLQKRASRSPRAPVVFCMEQATYGELRELLKQAKRWRANAALTKDRFYSDMFLSTALMLERHAFDRAARLH